MGISRGNITTNIIKKGLVFNMDAANRASTIPSSATTKTFNTVDTAISGAFSSTGMFDSVNAGVFDFDGLAEITTGGITGITPSNSICFWFNNSATAGGQAPLMASLNYTAATGENFAIRLETTNKLTVVLRKSGDYVVLNSNTVLADNTWYCIILTTLTSGSNITTTLYINGTQNLTATATNHSNLSDLQNGLTIGHWEATGNQNNFNGQIGNCHIYNRALPASEVLFNYNGLKSRFGL
jgi:hypothetical protein